MVVGQLVRSGRETGLHSAPCDEMTGRTRQQSLLDLYILRAKMLEDFAHSPHIITGTVHPDINMFSIRKKERETFDQQVRKEI